MKYLMILLFALMSVTAQAQQYEIIYEKNVKGITYAVVEINEGDSYRVLSTRGFLAKGDRIVTIYGARRATIEVVRNDRRASIRALFHGGTYFSKSEARFKFRRISDGTGLW